MKRLLTIIILLTAAFRLASCDGKFDNTDSHLPQLVVEGWIDEGGFPVVIVTRSLPVSTEYQSMEGLGDYLIRWAKVTVSDGTESVTLTGRYDEGYFPPYVYTTTDISGRAGVRYRLTVEYGNLRAEAETTVPPAAECSFRVLPCPDSDTLCQIKAYFTDNPAERGYYQFFTRVGSRVRQYQAAYLGSVDGGTLSGETVFDVWRGRRLGDDGYTPYFRLDDTVSVKFAHIDETSFRIWDSFLKTLSLSNNIFLSTSSNMESNIRGGSGYWCGYGAVTGYMIIRDSVDRRP